MTNPITATQSAPAVVGGNQTNKAPAASTTQKNVGAQDTVHLSSAAQSQLSAIKAAVQESTETQAQTTKEAHSGDHQAQRLLAKETAKAAKLK